MKNAIKHILDINLDDEFAYQRILEIFLNMTFPIYIVPIVKNKSKIYRTRQNINGNFSSFSELSFPPSEFVLDFGRINKPFQSVFYASDSWETTVTELMPNWFFDKIAGDIITLTTASWEIIENLNVVIIPDFNNKGMDEFNKVANYNEISDEQLMLLGFINQLFYENSFYNKRIYKITSAFCNAIKFFFKNKNKQIDGILYTSAQNRESWNVALEPHTIVKKMIKFDNVVKHFITKIDSSPRYSNIIEPEISKKIDFNNEIIIWT